MENNTGTMKGNKMLWWIIAIVAVIVIGALIMKSGGRMMTEENTTPDTELPAGVEPSEDLTEGSVNATVPAASISYQEALVKYKDTRIQVTASCQVSPNRVTYKNGTNIMIDNRSNTTKTIKLGSTFSIKPYGFKIVNVSSSTLPATWLMDCGASQNVATVLNQK